MIFARTVLRGVDVIVMGSAAPSAVMLDAVDIGVTRVFAAELSGDERAIAEEALCDAWERACWAPVLPRRAA